MPLFVYKDLFLYACQSVLCANLYYLAAVIWPLTLIWNSLPQDVTSSQNSAVFGSNLSTVDLKLFCTLHPLVGSL